MTTNLFRALVAGGVVLTVACLGVGSLAGRAPDCATGTVVELEVARTEQRAVELIGDCDEDGLDTLRDGLRADNLGFVPLYIASVGLWSLLGASALVWSSSTRRNVVRLATLAIVAAGVFDLVENHFLAHVVDAAGASPDIGPASAASIAKWVLVIVAVPIGMVAMVRCVRAALSPAERVRSAPG
jgi:hypothetical protein